MANEKNVRETNEKETKKMAEHLEKVHEVPVKPLELRITALVPKQKVLNLDTNQDAEIVVSSVRYELPKYDPAVHGPKQDFLKSAYAAALKLVQPFEQQIDALLYRATQNSYQEGKAQALAGGNYLTQDLRTKIVQIMRGNNKFTDASATECIDAWRAGYKDKKPGAIKVLAMAQDFGEFEL